MRMPHRENLINAGAFLAGVALVPVTYGWCGGNMLDTPPLAVLLAGFPIGFLFAYTINQFHGE